MKDELKLWIEHISSPRKEFNGHAACPWARSAQLTLFRVHTQTALNFILGGLQEVPPGSVLILQTTFEPEVVEGQNLNWIALVSNAADPIIVQNFRTTQSVGWFVLVQNRAELQHYREVLYRRGYFRNWSADDLKKIGVEKEEDNSAY